MSGLSWIWLTFVPLAASTEIFDRAKLDAAWSEEKIYFEPSHPEKELNWTGRLYRYSDGKCFDLIDSGEYRGPIPMKETPCPKKLKENALFPYEKIPDFHVFKTRFLKCLEPRDERCLRGMISKTAQFSLGVEPTTDRRDLMFRTWPQERFTSLKILLQKGTIGTGDERTFPPRPANGGMGHRGAFKRIDGRWRLVYFLAGD